MSFVPLLMFAILFGLSMDYQVFLVTRIQERYRKTKDNHEAVVEGLAVSARVITSAALIMVCVFSSFILNGDPTVKQFGVGMAVAIAIDATIVRCLLVPAVMMLLGRRTGGCRAGSAVCRARDRGRGVLRDQVAARLPGPGRAEPRAAGLLELTTITRGDQLGEGAGREAGHRAAAGDDDDTPIDAGELHVEVERFRGRAPPRRRTCLRTTSPSRRTAPTRS